MSGLGGDATDRRDEHDVTAAIGFALALVGLFLLLPLVGLGILLGLVLRRVVSTRGR